MDIDAVKRRYTETVSVIDAFGRAIKIGRLKPAQMLRAGEMGSTDNAAATIRLVCMVRGIDDKDLAFPSSRAEVESRLNLLEDEGISAVADGLRKLYGVDDDPDVKAPSVLDAAKNS